jgi:hypothetical protein
MAPAVASAQGLPSLLPDPEEPVIADVTSISEAEYVLTNKNQMKCTTSTVGTLEEESSSLGSFHMVLKGCLGTTSGISAKCTGLGDGTTGEILSLGTYHLVYDTGGTELGVAALYLQAPTHFTCAGLFLNAISGQLICLIKEPYVEKTLHEVVCTGASGKQTETYLNDSGTTVSPKLSVSEGESGSVEAAWSVKWLLLWLSVKTKLNTLVVIDMT